MPKFDKSKKYRAEPRDDGSIALIEERPPTPPPRPPLRPKLTLREAFGRLTGRSDPEPEPEPEPPAPATELLMPGTDHDLARADQESRRRDAELVAPDADPPTLAPSERRRWRGGCCSICGQVVPLRRRAVRIGDALGRVCEACPSPEVLAGEHRRLTGADPIDAILKRAESVLTGSHPTLSILASAWSEADRRDGLASVELPDGRYLKLDVREAVVQHLCWCSGGVVPPDDAEPFWWVANDAGALDPPAPGPVRRDPRRLLRCTWCGSEPDADPDTDPVTVGTLTGRLCTACDLAQRQEPADQPGRGLLDRLVDELPADCDAARRASTLISAAWAERNFRDLWHDGQHRERRESLTYAAFVARTRRAGEGDPDAEEPGDPFRFYREKEQA